MHKYDDDYPTRPGFEPGTSRLQASVDTNESSGQSQSIRMSHQGPLSIYDVQATIKCGVSKDL